MRRTSRKNVRECKPVLVKLLVDAKLFAIFLAMFRSILWLLGEDNLKLGPFVKKGVKKPWKKDMERHPKG